VRSGSTGARTGLPLIRFLNALLATEPPSPIAEVAILNPYVERESIEDKRNIVEVEASDDQGRLDQIAVQLLGVPDPPARILYTWAGLYSQQLRSGQDSPTGCSPLR
jgi:hypothetical protein